MTSAPETGGSSSRPPGDTAPRVWGSNWTRTWSAGPAKTPARPASRISVEFRQQDVLTVDLSPATVVTIYLSRDANLKLRPAIRTQLRPGARVVSHDFDMGDWSPDVVRPLLDESGMTRNIYLWRIGVPSPDYSQRIRE